jgi:hypothetical protein
MAISKEYREMREATLAELVAKHRLDLRREGRVFHFGGPAQGEFTAYGFWQAVAFAEAYDYAHHYGEWGAYV